jgi:3-hydroxyacyl-CoA dehydrogenase
MNAIRKAAVLGAGTMGSGIAAHLANAGLNVVLLDLEADIAARAVDQQIKNGGFMSAAFAKRIQPGSTTELEVLREVDWVVEAVAERLDVKLNLLQRLERVRRPETIVSSNTSTIPLRALLGGVTPRLASHLLITHFFNPPRRMRLLELVSGPDTDFQVITTIRDFADVRLGKAVVLAKDTPGFIANRIGAFWMAAAEHEAVRLGLDIEIADALISKPFGIPSTGVFGLFDLIGIDIMLAILDSLRQELPADDPLIEYAGASAPLLQLIRRGSTGRKAGAGFYRVSPDKSTREALDLGTGEYRARRSIDGAVPAAAAGNLRELMSGSNADSKFVSIVMLKTLAYAARLIPEIADTPDAVDSAMRHGYGWRYGPFELIDQMGPSWLAAELAKCDVPVPKILAEADRRGALYVSAGDQKASLASRAGRRAASMSPAIFSLSNLKVQTSAVDGDRYGSMWDMGDGVALFDFHTKLNVINSALLSTIEKFLERSKQDFRAVVIGNEGGNFGAGADLGEFLAIAQGDQGRLADLIDRGHALFRSIKFSRLPIVAATRGWALGGSCELALHCDFIQAGAELSMGLVETSIGLVPGWGGCKETLIRLGRLAGDASNGPVAAAEAAFTLLSKARVSTSAYEAKSAGYLTADDAITMNPDRLLADAKAAALRLATNYSPPGPASLRLSGAAGVSVLRNRLDMPGDGAVISAHDRVVSSILIEVLTGGPSADPLRPVPEDALLALERAAFLELFSMPLTLDRIRHTSATGRPLRN